MKSAYRAAALIAQGTVVDIFPRPDIDGYMVNFKVQRSWKAPGQAMISFTTGTDCRYETQVGDQQLLFFTKAPDGSLATDRCMGNGSVEAKAAEIVWLTKQKGVPAAQVRQSR